MMLVELTIYLNLDEYELLRDVAEAIRLSPPETAAGILRKIDTIVVPTGKKYPLEHIKKFPFLNTLQAEG